VFAKPKIKSTYELFTANDRVLVLCDERQPVMIEGAIYAKLAPLLDGNNTLADILEKLGGAASAPQVFFALEQLAKRGCALLNGMITTIAPCRFRIPRTYQLFGQVLKIHFCVFELSVQGLGCVKTQRGRVSRASGAARRQSKLFFRGSFCHRTLRRPETR